MTNYILFSFFNHFSICSFSLPLSLFQVHRLLSHLLFYPPSVCFLITLFPGCFWLIIDFEANSKKFKNVFLCEQFSKWAYCCIWGQRYKFSLVSSGFSTLTAGEAAVARLLSCRARPCVCCYLIRDRLGLHLLAAVFCIFLLCHTPCSTLSGFVAVYSRSLCVTGYYKCLFSLLLFVQEQWINNERRPVPYCVIKNLSGQIDWKWMEYTCGLVEHWYCLTFAINSHCPFGSPCVMHRL